MTESPTISPDAVSEGQESLSSLPPVLENFTRAITKKAISQDFVKSEDELSVYGAIATYLKGKFDIYFDSKQRTLIQGSSLTSFDFIGPEKLEGFKSFDAGNIEASMTALRPAFDSLTTHISALDKEKTARDKLTGLKTKFGELKDKDTNTATILTAMDTYLATNPSDSAEMASKHTAWETELNGAFARYKTAKITELRTAGTVEEAKLTALEAKSTPQEFLAELLVLAIPTTPGLSVDSVATELGRELDRTGNAGEALANMAAKGGAAGMLVGVVLRLLKSFAPGMYDSIFGKVKPSETMEVFADLTDSGHAKNIKHEIADESWMTHREHQIKATTWLQTQLQVDNKPVGTKDDLARSLFNTEFTIGDLKALAAKGTDPDLIEEEDLPSQYMEDLDIIRAVHKAIADGLGDDATKDGNTLAEYVSINLYHEETDT